MRPLGPLGQVGGEQFAVSRWRLLRFGLGVNVKEVYSTGMMVRLGGKDSGRRMGKSNGRESGKERNGTDWEQRKGKDRKGKEEFWNGEESGGEVATLGK